MKCLRANAPAAMGSTMHKLLVLLLATAACAPVSPTANVQDASTSSALDASVLEDAGSVVDAAMSIPDAAQPVPDAGDIPDASSAPDAGKASQCASTFGSGLTASFGRVDGTVVAVVQPQDTQCTLFNNDHLVLQVLMGGQVYRMVINIRSTVGDPNVRLDTLHAPLPAPAWQDGWHTGVSLDYVTSLAVHQADFTPHPMAELSQLVTDMLTLGAPVSVYAQSSGGNTAGSAHLVHRNNGGNKDGAIVLDPLASSPTWLLFSFADQQF